MNERIRELTRQAADEIADLFSPGFFDDKMVNDVAEINKKFAELIVKECAVLINDERRAFNPTEWDQGADWGHKNAVDAITKHFRS